MAQRTTNGELKNGDELYFAYGSNMHLEQMAARCPQSTVYGIGTLPGYKWSTSTRGGGNVLETKFEDHVEGVVFKVSADDVLALRGFEGVAQGNFVEERLEVQVERIADAALVDRTPGEAAAVLAQRSAEPESDILLAGSRAPRVALVYVSHNYKTPGPIREEYVGRMGRAMVDARKLGASRHYIDDLLSVEVFGKQGGAPAAA